MFLPNKKKKFWKKTQLLSASTTGWDIQSSFSIPWINELKNRAIAMLEKLQGKSLWFLSGQAKILIHQNIFWEAQRRHFPSNLMTFEDAD